MFRLPTHQKSCTRCSLGKAHQRKKEAPHQCAVFGQSNCDREDVKLIVVGHAPYFVTSVAFPRGKVSPLREYGDLPSEFFCQYLERVFGDEERFLDKVFFTYAVKCPLRIGRTSLEIKEREIKTCSTWLDQELSMLPPTCPILVTSNSGMKALLPHLKNGAWGNRLKVHRYQFHPVVVTIPFETVEKSMARRVTHVDKRLNKPVALGVQYEPLIVGSPGYFFHRDLQFLKSLYDTPTSPIPG